MSDTKPTTAKDEHSQPNVDDTNDSKTGDAGASLRDFSEHWRPLLEGNLGKFLAVVKYFIVSKGMRILLPTPQGPAAKAWDALSSGSDAQLGQVWLVKDDPQA